MKITRSSGCLSYWVKLNDINIDVLTNDDITRLFREFTERLNDFFKDDASAMINFMEDFAQAYGECIFISKEPCEYCGDTTCIDEVKL